MTISEFPDYYAILKVSQNATTDQITEAYKRESLKSHPDRTTNIEGVAPLPKDEALHLFTLVADAYYNLVDPKRRQEYNAALKSHSNSVKLNYTQSSEHHTVAGNIFVEVFQDLIRPEIENPTNYYKPAGLVSGAVAGFILGGPVGAFAGAVGMTAAGHIRDVKGVSVYEAYNRLDRPNKGQIISKIAFHIFSSYVSLNN